MTADPTYMPKTYRRAGGDELVVADGGKIIIESGGTIEAEAGAVMTMADGIYNVADLALTTGSIILGTASKGAALDAKGDGKILIGNGTTAAMQSIGTDATLSNAGALTIAANAITTGKILDAAVTSAKLAAGAGVAALLTAGLGGSHSVLKAQAEVHTVVALNATKARACLVLVVIDETYAAVGGVAPTIKVGETDDDNACFDVGVITNQAAGTVLAFAFVNTANKAIIITTTAATVNATGGASVTVLGIPTT